MKITQRNALITLRNASTKLQRRSALFRLISHLALKEKYSAECIRLLQYGRSSGRLMAVWILEQIGDSDLVSQLKSLLPKQSQSLQAFIENIIIVLQDVHPLIAITEALKDDETLQSYMPQAFYMLKANGLSKYREAIPILIKWLTEEIDLARRRHILLALTHIIDEHTSPDLVDTLVPFSQDADEATRDIAIQCLSQTHSPHVLHIARQMLASNDLDGKIAGLVGALIHLTHSANQQLQEQAVALILEIINCIPDQISDLRGINLAYIDRFIPVALNRKYAPSVRKQIIEYLQQAQKWDKDFILPLIHDPNNEILQAILKGINHYLDVKKTPTLLETLLPMLNSHDEQVFWAVAEALHTIPDARISEKLISRLNDQNPNICFTAITFLGRRKERQAIEPLFQKLNDPNAQVRTQTISALIAINDARTDQLLLNILKSDDHHLHCLASYALAERTGDDERLLSHIIAALTKFNAPILENIVAWLKKQNSAVVIARFTQALEQGDERVRRKAIYILTRLSDEDMLDKLVSWLADEDDFIRTEVTHALMQLEPSIILPRFLSMLQHGAKWARVGAAEALGFFDDAESEAALIHALADEDADVRYAAIESLRFRGGKHLAPHFISALNDKDERIQHSALWALQRINTPQAEAAVREWAIQ